MPGEWARLPAVLRRLHDGEVLAAHGRACVEGEPGLLARFLRRLGGLPRPLGGCELALAITPLTGGVAWRRRFGEVRFDTVQRPVGERRFVERIGAAELVFELRPEDGAVLYRHLSTALRLGSLRLPLASRLAPRVHARETAAADAPGRVRFEVETSWFGRTVVRYTGELEIEEAAPGSGLRARG